MANTNKQFREFDGDLTIPKSKRTKMNDAREASRTKLIKHFQENHPDYPISFWIQGSHKNGLNIRTEDDNCDQDDGIYVDRDPEESVDGATLQKWIYEAVKNDTTEGAEHKTRCVRKKYKEYNMGTFHIDYPAYYKTDDMDHPKLAVKYSELEESNPKEFTDWLNEQKDDDGQLVRSIKYLKGWCSYKSQTQRMLSGLTITVLVCNNVVFKKGRDDQSLYETLVNIQNKLETNWECIMPSTPNDDLLAGYDFAFKQQFLRALDDLVSDGKRALDEENVYEAAKLWKKHLGTRYPLPDKDTSTKNVKTGSQAALAGLVGSNKPYFDGSSTFL